MSMVIDLPAPLGRSKATISPGAMLDVHPADGVHPNSAGSCGWHAMLAPRKDAAARGTRPPSNEKEPGRDPAGLRFLSDPSLSGALPGAREIVDYSGSIAPGIGRTLGIPSSAVSTAWERIWNVPSPDTL